MICVLTSGFLHRTNAREYFTMAGNRDGLIKCHIALDDLEALKLLNISSPKNKQTLSKVISMQILLYIHSCVYLSNSYIQLVVYMNTIFNYYNLLWS